MQLASLTIENFKSIGRPVTIEFGKICLLFGENSSGKSTILQALHLMDEVLNERSNSPNQTRMGGDFIRLGGFEKFVNSRDLTKKTRIKATFGCSNDEFEGLVPKDTYSHFGSTSPLGRNIGEYIAPYTSAEQFGDFPTNPVEGAFFGPLYFKERLKSFGIEIVLSAFPDDYRAHANYLVKENAFLSSVRLFINGEDLINYHSELSDQNSDGDFAKEFCEFNLDHPCLPPRIFDWYDWGIGELDSSLFGLKELFNDEKSVESTTAEHEQEKHLSSEESWNRLVASGDSTDGEGWVSRLNRMFEPNCDRIVHESFIRTEPGLEISALLSVDKIFDLFGSVGDYHNLREEYSVSGDDEDFEILAAYVSIVSDGLIRAAARWCDDVIHVGPLRAHCDPSPLWTPENLEVTQTSKHGCWYDGTKAWYTLAGQRDSFLRKIVNHWMSDPEQFGFNLNAEALTDTLVREIKEELMVSFEQRDIDALIKIIIRNATLPGLTLRSPEGITVSSRDVGVGYSQLMPVVAATMYNHISAKHSRMRIFEQPELHIHARLQVILADLLIAGVGLDVGNQIVLETHSEYLLLRLMRRIRETHKEMNPSGPRLHAKDVSIQRVWLEDGETRVDSMPLDEYGNLTVEWPDNLLEISYRETFGK